MPSETRYFTGSQLSHAVTTILRSPSDLYDACKDFDQLPALFARPIRITGLNLGNKLLNLEGIGDKPWPIEIVSDVPGKELAFRSGPEAPLQIAGWVTFNQTENDRGTQVRATVEYLPGESEVAKLVHKVLGDSKELYLQAALHRLRQLMETGEIAVARGQPVGTNSSRSDRPGEKDDPRIAQPPSVVVTPAANNPAARK